MNIVLGLFALVFLYSLLPGGITPKETIIYGLWAGAIYLAWPFLRGLLTGTFRNIVTGTESLGRMIGTILYLIWTVLITILLIGPAMIFDSLVLLAPLSNFMWRFQPAIGIAIILSAIVLSLLGGFTRKTAKTIFLFAVVLGIGIVLFSYFADWYSSTKRLIVKVENGGVYLDPYDSVQVKKGDMINFAASGRYKAEVINHAGKTEIFKKSPKGNITDIGDFTGLGESRPRGEMYFEINSNKIILRDGQTKTVDFEGQVAIPIDGKLTVGFNDEPALLQKGTIRLKLLINKKGVIEEILTGEGWEKIKAIPDMPRRSLLWSLVLLLAIAIVIAVLTGRKTLSKAVWGLAILLLFAILADWFICGPGWTKIQSWAITIEAEPTRPLAGAFEVPAGEGPFKSTIFLREGEYVELKAVKGTPFLKSQSKGRVAIPSEGTVRPVIKGGGMTFLKQATTSVVAYKIYP